MLERMRRLVLATAVPLLLLLGACGDDPATTATSPTTSTASADPADPADGGTDEETGESGEETGEESGGTPQLLDFTATTVGGESFDGASLAGSPTVLWFWAPWCPTCRSQIPQVQDLAQAYGDRVDVVGIGSLDSAEAIADFAGDVDGVTHLEDVDGVLWQRFGITEQSSFVVLDADGEVAFEAGYGGEDDLAAEIDAVLG
jgi:thiol-disulfide isomerase/thioredoxin